MPPEIFTFEEALSAPPRSAMPEPAPLPGNVPETYSFEEAVAGPPAASAPNIARPATEPTSAIGAPPSFTFEEAIDEPAAGNPMSFLEPIDDDAPSMLGRGVDLAQAMGYGALEAGGELVGLEGLTEIGRAGRERNIAEAETAPRSIRLADADSVADFTTWASETFREQLPLMAPGLAGAAAGGALGMMGGPAAPITVPLGAAIGAFIPSAVLGVGETQMAIKEKGGTAPLYALGGGTLIGMLDAVFPGKIGGKLVAKFGFEAAERVAKRSFAKRALVEGGKGIALESVTEATQEAIAELSAALGTDSDVDWAGLQEQMIEAAVAGGMMGGVFGGATAVLPEGAQVPAPPPQGQSGDEPPISPADTLPALEGEPPPEVEQPVDLTTPIPPDQSPGVGPAPLGADREPVIAPPVGGLNQAGLPVVATDERHIITLGDESAPEPPAEPPPTAPEQPQADPAAKSAAVEQAASETNPEPSDAQIAAGNAKKGRVSREIFGLPIAIETPRGAVRRSKPGAKKPWAVEMLAHYGEVERTEGADGDPVDVYIGQDTGSDRVFVIDQYDPATGTFDEHKAVLGAADQDVATGLYDVHFDDGSGPSRRGGITEMSLAEFRDWAMAGDTRNALSSDPYKRVPAVAAEALKIVRQINPNAEVRFVDRLFGEGEALTRSGAATAERQEVAGAYTPSTGLIEISLNLDKFDPTDTAHHEAWHSIEALLDTKERNVLAGAYPARDGMSHDERTAVAFAAWAAKRGLQPPPVRKVFTKVRRLLARLGSLLRRRGFRTVEDIFERSERGEIGKRPPTKAKMGETKAGKKFAAVRRPTGPVRFSDPETEARYQEARGGLRGDETPAGRIAAWLEHIRHGFSRHFIALPNTPRFSKAHEALRQLEAAPQTAKDRAVGMLEKVIKGFSPEQIDLFTRKVILDDLAFENAEGHELPFGFTPATLTADKAAVDAAVTVDQTIGSRLAMRNEMLAELKRDLVGAGILSREHARNPAYFRHQVLFYARAQQMAFGSKAVKTPKPGYAKRREGSIADINANYLEAEFEYLHRAMIDLKMVETIKKLKRDYDVRDQAEAAARDAGDKSFRDAVPDGYRLWQPERGNHFFVAKSMPEHVIDRLAEKLETEPIPGVSQAEIADALAKVRDVLAIGMPKYEMVIPEELAATLDDMRPDIDRGLFDHMLAEPMRWWKRWVLINPRRVLKYNLNNLSGDMDAVIAGAPRALTKLPQAIRELWSVMHGGDMSARYNEAIERGVFNSGFAVQEIPDINILAPFEHVLGRPTAKEPVRLTKTAVMKIWRALKDYTQFRENWLRYAAYLHYAEVLEAGQPMSKVGYGATNPAMVDALDESLDKAGLLARDLVGDYGNVSAFGLDIRAKLIPFYSWMEINTKRYVRLMGNAWHQGLGAQGRVAGVTALKGARISAHLAIRMGILYGLVSVYNNVFHGDEEDELDAEDRVRLHLNLGRDDDGNIRLLRFQGALSDFLSWFGIENVAAVISEIEAGPRILAGDPVGDRQGAGEQDRFRRHAVDQNTIRVGIRPNVLAGRLQPQTDQGPSPRDLAALQPGERVRLADRPADPGLWALARNHVVEQAERQRDGLLPHEAPGPRVPRARARHRRCLDDHQPAVSSALQLAPGTAFRRHRGRGTLSG